MRKALNVLIPFLGAATLLSACGSSASTTAPTATTATSAASAESSPAASTSASGESGAVVKSASNSTIGGTILVDSQGMTLYTLSGESNGKFICTSAPCLKAWHPLAAAAGSTPSGSVGSLATVKRPDGTTQVTYKGQPLYTFAEDTKPGQASGQGIKDVGTWNVIVTGGSSGTAPAASESSTGSARGGSGGSSSESESSSSSGSGGGYAY